MTTMSIFRTLVDWPWPNTWLHAPGVSIRDSGSWKCCHWVDWL